MRKRRVIAFDDDAVLLKLYRDIFTFLDYEVLAFSEPIVCPAYGNHLPTCTKLYACADIMITDYQMPGMTGLDLLEAQLPRGCSLTIRNKALITGYDNSSITQRVKKLECAFFQKPLILSSLLKWISECEGRMDLSQPLVILRKESRLSTVPEMQCRLSFDENNTVCIALNVSESGCCIKLPFALREEQTVRINTESSVMSRAAMVRWISRQDDGTYLAGLNCY